MTYRFSRSVLLASTMAALWMVLWGEASYGQPPPAESRLYWTEERDLGWLRRSDLDGSNLETLVETDIAVELQMSRPWAIALHYSTRDKIYWTEWKDGSGTGAIRRSALDGSHVETLVTGLDAPHDLAMDPFEHKMYWTDYRAGTIQRADLDGAGVETLVTGLEAPEHIAVDMDWYSVAAGKPASPTPPVLPSRLFWTDGRAGTIQRSDLGGSNIEVIVEGIDGPAGLWASAYGEVLWGERETGTIRSAAQDGSNIEVIHSLNDYKGSPGEELWDFAYTWWDLSWRTWNPESREGFIRRYEPPDVETEELGGLLSFLDLLYWTEPTGIHRYQPSQADTRVYLGVEGPGGIALDVDRSRMYWVDKGKDIIRRSDLDGTDVEDLITGVEDPEDIALDTVSGMMYWTERGTNAIRRADLDGGKVETIAESDGPKGIALDVTRGRVYWTARGGGTPDAGVIQRSGLDGSDVQTLAAGLSDPEDIALDLLRGKVYYWEGGGRIRRSNLDGSDGETVVTGLARPVEIALDAVEGKLYWTDKQGGTIHRSDLEGGNVEAVVSGLVRPVGLALDVPAPLPPVDTAPVVRTEVEVTVQGAVIEGLTIELARAGSTQPPEFAWSAITDEAGRASLTISSPGGPGDGELYHIRALDAGGEVVGRWEIPLDSGWRWILELTPGAEARVVTGEKLGEPDPCSNGIVVPEPRINRGLVEDCRGLLAFRDSLDFSNLNWTTTIPITQWASVGVRDSRVTQIWIELPHRGRAPVRGSISPDLGRLEALEVLGMPWHGYWLTGPIPPELGQLRNLRYLDLAGNGLTGPIPAELGQLEDLEWLNLSGNELTGSIPAELGQLEDLEWLDLSANELRGSIPPQLGNLAKLEKLFLNGNGLSGPIPAGLGQLGNLEWLHLNGNELSGSIPVELGRLASLERLHLKENRLTGRIPPELGQLRNLKDFFEAGYNESGLDLSHNRLTGPIPPELGDLTMVKSLRLRGNRLTGPILPGLAHFTVLDLSSNEMKGPIPSGLETLTNLETLILSDNELTGGIPPQLGELSNLRGLALDHNQLTGTIPLELGNLTNLRSLNLSENELTGPIPPELGRLTHLESLRLQGNELTGTIPPELEGLRKLRRLVLDDNHLTGCAPVRLSRWLEGFPICPGSVVIWDYHLRSIDGVWRSERRLQENLPPGTALDPIHSLSAEDAVLSFSLGGPDSTAFDIDGAGQLTVGSGTELDYESRKSYTLQVYVSDGRDYDGQPDPAIDDTLLVTIDLVNVEEPGTATVKPYRPVVGEPTTASLTDPDGLVRYDPPRWQWQWTENLPSPAWEDIPGSRARSEVYTPVSEDEGRLLKATVTYGDGHGTGKSAESKATAAVVSAGAADSTATAADFDGDGEVGFSDFFLFADAFGSGDSRFDLDGNGVVDFTDFFLFADHFGQPERSKLLAMAREMIGLPGGPALQNAPNPFNSRTAIAYFLLTPGPVRLEIYNTLGQPVRRLVDELQSAGRHQVYWDARDERGATVAAGVYLSRLQHPDGAQTRRLLLVK